MKDLSLSKKLTGGFGVLVALIAATGVVGYVAGERNFAQLHAISEKTLPSVDLLLQADRDLQQALVAERSMIYSNPESDAFKVLLKDHAENLQQADERWKKFKEIGGYPAELEDVLTKYDGLIGQWIETTNKIKADRVANTPEGRREAIDLATGLSAKRFDAARECLNQLTDAIEAQAASAREAAYKTNRVANLTNLGVTLAGVAVGIFLTWAMGVRLSRRLRGVAGGMTQSAEQTAAAAQQISSSSQQLAEGAGTQAASLEESSAALEEVASMVKRNAEHATKASELARTMREAADRGATEMDRMSEAVTAIAAASGNIGNIIKTIDEIAFQTNILALNAAVEAARAGEAGAGFAIVAEEVRALAQRSAQAARETSVKIEDSLAKSQNGVALSQRVSEVLKEITGQARDVDQTVAEIATGSRQQSEGITQINQAVSQMDRVTQANAAAAEQSAGAAEELNSQTAGLREMGNELMRIVDGAGGAKTKAPDFDGPGTRMPQAMQAEAGRARVLHSPARPAKAPRLEAAKVAAPSVVTTDGFESFE